MLAKTGISTGVGTALLGLLTLLVGCREASDPVEHGPVAAAVAGELSDGGTLQSGDMMGKVVLLNFWATWCAPCVASNPQVQALHEHFVGDDRVAVVGVHTDALPGVTEYMDEHGYTFPTLTDGTRVALAFGVDAAPVFVVLGIDGTVAFRVDGYEPGDETRWAEAVDAALGGLPNEDPPDSARRPSAP